MGFHFMFMHGWAGGALVDLSRGHEMVGWYVLLLPQTLSMLFHAFVKVWCCVRLVRAAAHD